MTSIFFFFPHSITRFSPHSQNEGGGKWEERGEGKRTISGTLGGGLLAATTADADAVDNVALLGLVSETAGLVGARGAAGTVADVQLTELY